MLLKSHPDKPGRTIVTPQTQAESVATAPLLKVPSVALSKQDPRFYDGPPALTVEYVRRDRSLWKIAGSQAVLATAIRLNQADGESFPFRSYQYVEGWGLWLFSPEELQQKAQDAEGISRDIMRYLAPKLGLEVHQPTT